MRKVQKLINGYSEDRRTITLDWGEIYNYYSSGYFDIDLLLDELNEFDKLVDKILLLKFFKREIDKEIDKSTQFIERDKALIKKKEGYSDNVNKEIKENLKYCSWSKKVLEKHQGILIKELNDYSILLKASERKQIEPDIDEIIALVRKGNTNGKKSKLLKSVTKIRWNGTETQFVYLFEQLVKAGLLNNDFLDTIGGGYSLLAQHFENREGKPFKNTQLANTFQNLAANKSTPGKPKGADKIDKMISKTKRKK